MLIRCSRWTAVGLIIVTTCLSVEADVNFAPQTLDDQIEIGYGLVIGDVDGDGHRDVVLADKSEFAWYQNPGERGESWTRHLMLQNVTERDNVCLAARDLDGDGRVEVAVGANWNPGETSDTAKSGGVFFLVAPHDRTSLWRAVPIRPYDPTTHRMHWVRWSDDRYRLVVLPLHGLGNRRGEGDPVRVTAYSIPLEAPAEATSNVIHDTMHMTHNFDVETKTDGAQETLWIAGKEGIDTVTADGIQTTATNPLSLGAGEVRRAHVTPGRRNMVAIEPMHGTQVVYYEEDEAGGWRRQVLDATVNEGHALAAGDLLGLGRDQIVAGWRRPNAQGRVGIRMYIPDAKGMKWTQHVVDDNQMACEDLKLADLDGDGRLDIIAAGRASNNLVVYWNDER